MNTQTSRSLCERCGNTNPADAHFCIDCGYSLEAASTGATTQLRGRPCLHCRTVNPEDARFCVTCGRTFDPQPTLPRSPRTHPPQQRPSQARPPQPRPMHQHGPWPASHPRRHGYAPPVAWGGVNMGVVFLLGLFVLLATHTVWPGILLLAGIAAYLNGMNHGRPRHATRALVWLAGLTVLFAFHAFWPGIIVLVALNFLLAR